MPRKTTDRKQPAWMRAQFAAKDLGVTRPTVLAMVARKELRSKTVGGVLFVKREDVELYAQKNAA